MGTPKTSGRKKRERKLAEVRESLKYLAEGGKAGKELFPQVKVTVTLENLKWE